MKKPKKLLPPAATTALFVVAVLMLLGSSISGTRAALTYFSETYSSRLQMYDIGVTLLENDRPVAWRNYDSAGDGTWEEQKGTLFLQMIPEGEEPKLGKAYDVRLKVGNTGTINQYVRVSIYRYWLDEKGTKLTGLSPDLIDLHLVNLGTDWIEDAAARTEERTVLYYNKLLYAQGEGTSQTPLFADSLTIDGSIAKKVTQETKREGNYTTIITSYDYDGAAFQVEVQVDAVQEHNMEDAAWSAWGRRVTIRNGILSLRD